MVESISRIWVIHPGGGRWADGVEFPIAEDNVQEAQNNNFVGRSEGWGSVFKASHIV